MAATGVLKVDTAKLRSTASSFQSTGGQIRSLTSEMTSIVQSLSGTTFSGDAADAYKRQFNGLQDDIERLHKMINEHVNDLNEIAAAFDGAIEQSTQTASSLKTDVIS